MVSGDERDDFDLLRVEAPQVAVLDQIVRMVVMSGIADVRADVVHHRGELEPLARVIRQSMNSPCLIEERERQAPDLLGMDRLVVASLGQGQRTAASDVGNLICLGDLAFVGPDVVEDDAFAQGEVAQRDLGRAKAGEDGVDEHRSCDDQVRPLWVESGYLESFTERQRDHLLAYSPNLLARHAQVPDLRWRGATCLGCCDDADAQDSAGRSDDAIEAGIGDGLTMPIDLAVDMRDELLLVPTGERVGPDEAFGEPDGAKFEALRGLHRGGRTEGDLHAAAADVDDDRPGAAHLDAVHGRQVNEACFLDARNDSWSDPGAARNPTEKVAAVLGFTYGARRRGEDLLNAVRFGEPSESGEGLQACRHRLRRELASIEAAGAQAHHRLLLIDDLEREIGPHVDHDHVDGVGADVDRCESHGYW